MKRKITILILTACAALLLSCNRETSPDLPATREISFTAVREESTPASKTTVQPDGKTVWWDVGDKILVFAGPGAPAAEFVSTETEPGPVAVFKGTAGEADTYYGIYPVSDAAAVASDGSMTVFLSDTQNAVEGSFDKDLFPVVAIAEGSRMNFRNAAGGIKFSLAEEGVSAVVIRSRGGEAIAGTAKFAFTEGAPVLQEIIDGRQEITLNAPSGGFVPGKFYYSVLFPMSLSEGFTMTLKHSGGAPDSEIVSTGARTISRGVFGVLRDLQSSVPDPGTIRFDVTAGSEICTALGVPQCDLGSCTVNVNGSDFTMLGDTGSGYYIEVPVAADGKYDAVLMGPDASAWCGTDPFSGVAVPYSQFWSTTKAAYASYPRYLGWSADMGGTLNFTDCLSLVNLRIKGTGSISSVKIKAIGGERLSGRASYSRGSGFSLTEGLDWAVVNCTEHGSFVPLGSDAVSIPVFISPGNYSEGLELTICDNSHKMMKKTISPLALAPGQVCKLLVTWAPDSDLLFYEGFDNFVWGGDIMSGEGAVGYAPDDSAISISGGQDRDGYAASLTPVAYNNPGTGFIQPNSWSGVETSTVGDTHSMSDAYMASRNIDDWVYLFRCQECPGYLAVGTGNSYRGQVRTPFLRSIESITDMVVSFRFSLQAGFNDALLVDIINAGYISECKIDGAPVTPLSGGYKSNHCEAKFAKTVVEIPASAAVAKQWHTAELTVTNATDATLLDIKGASSSYGIHGFWLDDIEMRAIPGTSRKGNLRLMYWNIQNGMWYDQANNYKDFVAFVKKYDPDVCVWCEASSIYKNNTNTSASSSSRYLPSNWLTLCKRYGHNYGALSGWRDNYPQEITAKYPITTLLKITDTDTSGKPVAHGAAIQKITVSGQDIYFVTCHMWPQAYGFGVASSDQERSKAAYEGDYYRQHEMQYIIDHTINSPDYAGVDKWILLGDMNSRSRVDNGTYNYTATSTAFLTQDVILNQTDMIDVIGYRYPAPANFVASTYGAARIDYVYVSPALKEKVVNGFILADQWNYEGAASPYVSSFRMPSDHRPIIVDFEF
ncbi:MAG: metal-dependent hydrolase [Bacteroidales bacterium]|nr:metal-dependent hydrolase [Bacteroidales bacterium]